MIDFEKENENRTENKTDNVISNESENETNNETDNEAYNEINNESVSENADEATNQDRQPDFSGEEKPLPTIQKKKKFAAGSVLLGMLVGFLLCVALLLIYYAVLLRSGNALPTFGIFSSAETSVDMKEFQQKAEEIEYYLNEFYIYDKNYAEATDGAIRGLYDKLTETDDYAEYYTKKEYSDMVGDMSGSFVGIGVSVVHDDTTGGVLVLQVIEGGSAQDAGMKAGDVIIESDGLDLRGMDLDTAVSYIRGEKDTSVTITVLRDGEKIEFHMDRRPVDNITVYSSLLEQDGDKIGYIYVRQFLSNTPDAFSKAIETLSTQGAAGFVVDLRENPGGDMNACLNMLDYVLEDHRTEWAANVKYDKHKDSTLLLTINETKSNQQYFADDGNSVQQPIVVLVDEHSASASEIFAGVMKAYGSSIIGVKTFGKGIVQSLLMLYDMSGIKFTSGEYILPDGYHVHKEGVHPDVEVEASEKLKETGVDIQKPDPLIDNQLAEAIKALKEKL